jgi:hypothetical protein
MAATTKPPRNADMPIGTAVCVWRDDGTAALSTTAGVPWQLDHGTWVVFVHGIRGYYALSHVRPTVTLARVPEAAIAKAEGRS